MNQENDRAAAGAHPRMLTESVPFTEIPGQTRLFLDYLADPASLSQFYPSAVTSHRDIAGRVPEVLAAYNADRDTLCDILARQNTLFGAGDASLGNIETLRDADCVAVLTGQQAGLLTGPLYTIYKALSAIKMAEELREQGIRAVAVFWAATEDHDIDEVSNVSVIGDSDELLTIKHSPPGAADAAPVGNVELGNGITATLGALTAALPRTQFSDELAANIAKLCLPDDTFGSSFARIIARLFSRYGLIVVDPMDARLKSLASPVYLSAAQAAAGLRAALAERNASLDAAGYHRQVAIDDEFFPLFFHDDAGRRVALKQGADGAIKITSSRETLEEGEIFARITSEPERFSPNVMLRPAVQDHLFPTVCYFGGAAEIAYFAQNSEVYRVLKRPVTPILHRQSFTVIERRIARAMEKLGLRFHDVFALESELRRRIAEVVIEPAAATEFESAESAISSELDRIDRLLSAADPTLAAGFARRRSKVLFHIDAARRKYGDAALRRESVAERRLRSVMANLAPNGAMQERTVNITNFLDRFGDGFIDMLYDNVDLADRGHRLIYL